MSCSVDSSSGNGRLSEEIAIKAGPGIPEGYLDMDYGTSGFRGKVDNPPNQFDHISYRCGVLVAVLPFLRNKKLYHSPENGSLDEGTGRHVPEGDTIVASGVVITASHNPPDENGIKLLEMDGNMLDMEWEHLFTWIVNFKGPLSSAVSSLVDKYGLRPVRRNATRYRILLGYDTRESSGRLAALFIEGVNAMSISLKLEGVTCTDLGRITTPSAGFLLSRALYEAVDDKPYVNGLKEAFYGCLSLLQELGHLKPVMKSDRHTSLYYDCSYGVGGCVIYRLFDCLRALGILPHLCHSPIYLNRDEKHLLNNGCGTHYVLSYNRPPVYLEKTISKYEGRWFCAFDGDADRLAYYGIHNGSVKIMDGIHQLVVSIKFMAFILKRLDLSPSDDVRVGILVNPYANGAATKYIENLINEYNGTIPGVRWALFVCRVGIKHMQAKVKDYSITLFFEANGHGNIVFSKDCIIFKNKGNANYVRLLRYIAELYSSPLGDAITNSIVLELALKVLHLSHDDVLTFYKELPYINVSARIPTSKRAMFKMTPESDIIIEEPRALRLFVDDAVSKVDLARAFIRPSGTESLCRIYAEARTQEAADKLAHDIEDYLRSLL